MAESYHPVIILPGIGQSKVQVIGENGEAVRDAWPISADPAKLLGPLKGPLMKMMLFRRDGGFSDAAAKAVASLADDLTSFPDGSTKFPLRALRWDFPVSEYNEEQKKYLNRMVPVEELSRRVGEENIYFFAYNSFGDAFAIADELDAYIQQVKQRSGSDRVQLLAVSLGGVLALAYFDRYGEKGDVSRWVNVVAALNGTHLLSDVLEANFSMDDPKAMLHMIGGSAEETFGDLMGMLPEGVAEAVLEKCAGALAERIVLNSTMMWGAVPRDRYVVLKNRYLLDCGRDRILADADRLHRIHTDMQGFARHLEQQGVSIFNICGYGKRLFALCASENMSDGIVDTASASMGAECMDFGRTDAFLAGDLVSPDGKIDASACALPERTWFFAGQGHDAIAYNDTALKLIARIMSDSGFDSVHSDPAFPRFNWGRNLKKLLRELLPQFEALDTGAMSDFRRERYALLQKDWESFLAKTVIDDPEETAEMESRFQAFLASEME